MALTREDWLRATEEAQGGPPPGALSGKQLQELWGMSERGAREKRRRLVSSGRLRVVGSTIEDGHRIRLYMPTILPTPVEE